MLDEAGDPAAVVECDVFREEALAWGGDVGVADVGEDDGVAVVGGVEDDADA